MSNDDLYFLTRVFRKFRQPIITEKSDANFGHGGQRINDGENINARWCQYYLYYRIIADHARNGVNKLIINRIFFSQFQFKVTNLCIYHSR